MRFSAALHSRETITIISSTVLHGGRLSIRYDFHNFAPQSFERFVQALFRRQILHIVLEGMDEAASQAGSIRRSEELLDLLKKDLQSRESLLVDREACSKLLLPSSIQ